MTDCDPKLLFISLFLEQPWFHKVCYLSYMKTYCCKSIEKVSKENISGESSATLIFY